MGTDTFTSKKNAFLTRVHELAPIFQRGAFRSEDLGSGMGMRLKRLLRYRSTYLKHVAVRLGISFGGDSSVKLFWGRTITLPVRDVNTRSMRQVGMLGGDEYRLISFLIQQFREDDVFYDVGANYGFYTLLAQEFLAKGQVHAFEPSEKVFAYLKQAKNDTTFLNNCALADVTGEISFFDTSSQHRSGKSTILQEVATLNHAVGSEVRVPSITLDEYCRTHKAPTIMKIDVEGGESKVLAGGMQTLRSVPVIIAMELWSGERSNFSRTAISVIRDLGYAPSLLSPEGEAQAMTFDELETYLSENRTDNNFIFQKR